MTALACPRCLRLARQGKIRTEMVQRLPDGAWAPLALDGSGRCCYDCQAADTLVRMAGAPNFEAARICTGNDRQEHLRLPGVRMGLVRAGLLRPNKPGDFEAHLKWLDQNRWFGIAPETEP
jgi:hypothetical protein